MGLARLRVVSGGFCDGGGSGMTMTVEMVAIFVADSAANGGSRWWSKVAAEKGVMDEGGFRHRGDTVRPGRGTETVLFLLFSIFFSMCSVIVVVLVNGILGFCFSFVLIFWFGLVDV